MHPTSQRVAAQCQCCDRKSRPVEADHEGEPDMWKLPRNWSQAPFPADYLHTDGTIGSKYTCPACNARLNKGETLPLRAGPGRVRNVAAEARP